MLSQNKFSTETTPNLGGFHTGYFDLPTLPTVDGGCFSVGCPVPCARFVRARVCRSVTVVMLCCCSLFVQVSVFRLAGVYLRRRVSLSCVTVLMLSLATAPACRACSPDDFFFKFIFVAFFALHVYTLSQDLLVSVFIPFFVCGGGAIPFQ